MLQVCQCYSDTVLQCCYRCASVARSYGHRQVAEYLEERQGQEQEQGQGQEQGEEMEKEHQKELEKGLGEKENIREAEE